MFSTQQRFLLLIRSSILAVQVCSCAQQHTVAAAPSAPTTCTCSCDVNLRSGRGAAQGCRHLLAAACAPAPAAATARRGRGRGRAQASGLAGKEGLGIHRSGSRTSASRLGSCDFANWSRPAATGDQAKQQTRAWREQSRARTQWFYWLYINR